MSAVMSASLLLFVAVGTCKDMGWGGGGDICSATEWKARERKTERGCGFSGGDRRGNNPFYCRFLSCRCEGSEFGFPLISGGNQIQQ